MNVNAPPHPTKENKQKKHVIPRASVSCGPTANILCHQAWEIPMKQPVKQPAYICSRQTVSPSIVMISFPEAGIYGLEG